MKGNAMAASDRPHSLPAKDAARGKKSLINAGRGKMVVVGHGRRKGKKEKKKRRPQRKKRKSRRKVNDKSPPLFYAAAVPHTTDHERSTGFLLGQKKTKKDILETHSALSHMLSDKNLSF